MQDYDTIKAANDNYNAELDNVRKLSVRIDSKIIGQLNRSSNASLKVH